ncbi:GIY-YIG nuclease family protein [Phormidium sp. FACHB-592]|uniref:GIY-YIG nuclease family protein n=1 Tax=Stenomitos frigidus AS-A4 TaxID=2933935 RepID=A0ABV0KP20_9CYAN|nr:GIY-YIG nuclease family protein [Phormidium sp. FACHB-592]
MLQEFSTLPNLKLLERERLPECSAIYFAISRDQVLYVGLATNLRNRWQKHHRSPQLEAINKRCEVRLFWLSCAQKELNELEQQYIEYYCPTLNQTKIPERQLIPSFQMLTLSLKKLSERVICFGVCPADNQQLKTLFLGYLAGYREMQLATATLRKSLQAITKKPNSLFRWTEVTRRKDGAHWLTRCNGIEIQLIPWFGECVMHNPSMYEVMVEKRFSTRTSIPAPEYESMRQEVKAMSFRERLELARSSEIGQKLFPLECAAQFRTVSGVEILCLTDSQLQALLSDHSNLQEQHPKMTAVHSDPVPSLEF